MTMRLAMPSLLLLALAAPLAAQATTHPSFVGTWVLDPAKTVTDGVIPPPTVATYIIAQHGDTIVVDESMTTSSDGVVKATVTWGTDGKVWKNQAAYQGTPMDLSTTLVWEGAVLGIYSTTDFMGSAVERNDHWSLSADGKVLTVQDRIIVAGTDYSGSTLTFNKKP